MKKTLTLIAAGSLSLAAGTVSAATYHEWIDLRGDRGLQGLGVPLTYSGSGGLTLDVTGHILDENGSIGDERFVGEYSKGVGVTTYNDTTHEVDSEGNSDEVAKFAFNYDVTIKAIKFDYEDSNDDFSFSFLDAAGDLEAFYGNVDIEDTGKFGLYEFENEWTSTMFGIGAADQTCYGWSGSYSCDNYDNFKIAKIKVSYDVPEVPLPAAGWMLIAGLGGIAAMKRRKRAA